MTVIRLSEAEKVSSETGSALLMVGSFAPVHAGHFDAMYAAEQALTGEGEGVVSSVFAPNSDSYVSFKVNDTCGRYSFERRVAEFLKMRSPLDSPTYVDDITGQSPPERSISEEVIDTVSRTLGIQACKAVLVVGSDQVSSMRSHIENNRVVCVLRPGSLEEVDIQRKERWFRRAIDDGRCILTVRKNMATDICSTDIREQSE